MNYHHPARPTIHHHPAYCDPQGKPIGPLMGLRVWPTKDQWCAEFWGKLPSGEFKPFQWKGGLFELERLLDNFEVDPEKALTYYFSYTPSEGPKVLGAEDLL